MFITKQTSYSYRLLYGCMVAFILSCANTETLDDTAELDKAGATSCSQRWIPQGSAVEAGKKGGLDVETNMHVTIEVGIFETLETILSIAKSQMAREYPTSFALKV